MSLFFDDYYAHVEERAKEGIPPLALSQEQTEQVIELLKNPPAGKEDELVALITDRVNPGVDPAAQVKAEFLFKVAHGEESTPLISAERAVELLGTMVGGYNLDGLIKLVDEQGALAVPAGTALKNMVLSVNRFEDVQALADKGNDVAKDIINSWAVREEGSAHTGGVLRNIRTGEGEGGRGKIVGIDFAVDFIDNGFNFFLYFRQ